MNYQWQPLIRIISLGFALLLLAGIVLLTPVPVRAATDCTTADVPQAECEALVALYTSTDGDNWTDNTGWLQDQTVCDWYGVSCLRGHVAGLDFNQNNLTGSIPPEIGDLTELQTLNLRSNQLTALPVEIGNLSSLTLLSLSGNQLTALPAEIGNLTSLVGLHLSGNQLTALPPQIGNLSGLNQLDLSHNELMALPAEIGNLFNLNRLDLSHNELTALSAEISNLFNLNWLDVGHNSFIAVPSAIWNLLGLETLGLYDNQLTILPAEVGNLTNLLYLSLSNNRLITLPTEISNLSNLYYLYLGYNALPINGLDPSLEIFVDNHTESNWRDTQTVPPHGIMVNVLTDNTVTLSWTPVGDTTSNGYYEVGISTIDGGPYTFDVANRTANKLATGIMVGNLATGTTYYFVVRAYRAAYTAPEWYYPSYSELTSINSVQVSAMTTGETPTEVPTQVATETPTDVATEVATTDAPTDEPTDIPTLPGDPTDEPTSVATQEPTDTVTEAPTEVPTTIATEAPTEAPTDVPTAQRTTTEVPGTELLVNGGFEAKTGDGKPDFAPWTLKNPTKDKIRCNKPDKEFSYAGDCAFAFKGGTGEAATLQQVATITSLPFAVADTLDFSAFVKATNATAAGKIKVVVKYSDADSGKLNLTIATNTDYSELADSLDLTSANVTKVKVQIKHSSPAGKVYVDAVSLTLNPAGAAGLGSRAIPLP